MPTSKIPSPARSQGAYLTPRRLRPRTSRSVGSPARSNVSGRLTSIIDDYKNQDSFAYSPLSNRKSVLKDNTNIEEPRRASWWKQLGENSRDVIEVMKANDAEDVNNVIEEYVEVLSQERKDYTLDLPDSSDNETINSIVINKRKLFTQKDVALAKQKFDGIIGDREKQTKINKTNNDLQDNSIKVTTKNLFGHGPKRSRPAFPKELLNVSLNKTANAKAAPPEVNTQVKSLFGNRPTTKRKNIFVDFIVSESEDEIPEIQPIVFAFPKKPKQSRRPSSTSRASSITTDVEMDGWKMLPSSTMMDNQLEEAEAAIPEHVEMHLHYEEEENQENDQPTLVEQQTEKQKNDSRKKSFTNIVEISQKNIDKSPEAVLQHTSTAGESFLAKGRNTSIRKTKSMIKNLNIKPSLAPVRESIDFSDGTKNSSAEGSGWDSHRTTRKTIRQTMGKDFSPRKSLRALVMEKSAKRFTAVSEINDISKEPQANSTEYAPNMSFSDNDSNMEAEEIPVHEVSKRTRQATLEKYLQSVKRKNMQMRMQVEEDIKNSLKNTPETPTFFKKPLKPGFPLHKGAKSQQKQPKPNAIKSTIIPLDNLPTNLLEDLKYKPPKRYKPGNAAWITKRLYSFLENKLEPKYDYKARVRAERLVESLYNFTKDSRRHPTAPSHAVEVLKREMAKLKIVRSHHDFYVFFHEYMPREIRVKVVPDIVNKISVPKDIFADIM